MTLDQDSVVAVAKVVKNGIIEEVTSELLTQLPDIIVARIASVVNHELSCVHDTIGVRVSTSVSQVHPKNEYYCLSK